MPNPQELRKQAEEEIARTANGVSDEILHELQMQMQNEELQRSQKALAESRNRYLDLYEFSPLTYLTLDQHGLIQEINLTGAILFGIERQQLLQRRFADFIDSADTDRWHLFFAQQIKQKQRESLDLTLKKSDQSVFFVQLDCLPILNEDGLKFRIALTDVSEYKRLIESRNCAEKASQLKSDFISTMSHEMRTLMTVILGFAQVLQLHELTAPQYRRVSFILTAGYHLRDLINQVLDLAKIESGNINLAHEVMRLNSVVQSCITLTQPSTLKNKVQIINHITTGCDVAVMASPLHFKQVLLNLISNAIKYNREGGRVSIDCEKVSPQMLRINITDTGKGLSELEISKLFQPFERLSAKNSNVEGAGLGLVITKKLIEVMNGKIGVKSTVELGCCFWIEIPLA